MIEKEKTLKPCPFCGQSPVTKVEVTQMGGNKDQINFLIYCPDCKYVVKNIYLDITPSNISLEGSFVAKVKANSYNEAMDIFDDDSLSNIKELYIECVTEYDKDGNEIEVYQ